MPLMTYATASLATGLLAASSSKLASAGWHTAISSLRARTLRGQEQRRLRREAQHARLASELRWQTAALPDAAWRVVEVMEIVDESADCRSFYLRDPSGDTLPKFQPGQFVAVRPALGGQGQPTRCYSLSDSPSQPWWRISVKRQAPSAASDQRTGLSLWLHQRIGVGDCLLVSGPSGQFKLDSLSTAPLAFLAAGIGITPIISMLKHVLETQPGRPMQVLFQAQDEEHWPFGRTLHAWQAPCDALQVSTYFSRSTTLPAVQHGQVTSGKFDALTIASTIEQSSATQFYMCGPDAWTSSLTQGMIANNIPIDQMHFESFGGPSHSLPAQQTTVEPWSLHFTGSGVKLPISQEPTTIWQAAKRCGLELPAACHTGACGTCRLKLRAGHVNYASPPDASRSEGEVLACVAQPVGHVEIEA